MSKIKKGATLRAEFQFPDADEWAEIYPFDSVVGAVALGDSKHSLTVTADPANARLLVSADTAGWALGKGQMDISVTRGAVITPVPYAENIAIEIVEGVSL